MAWSRLGRDGVNKLKTRHFFAPLMLNKTETVWFSVFQLLRSPVCNDFASRDE